MEAYSQDLRLRILEDCDGGMTTRVAATKYRVSESWIRRLKQRRRDTGETTPRSSRPKTVRRVLAEHTELLRQLVRDDADATLDELRAKLPVAVSRTTLWRALAELKLSFKKKSSTPRSKIGRTSGSNGSPGKPKWRASTSSGWCSSTRPGRRRT